jgi:branched-chain amino acid transport system ATP-binding protein
VLPAGGVVALVGPNGAGKTTLLSTASGLLRPRAGSVVLDRRDITTLRPEERVGAGLCHITEGRSIFPGLTVAENLRVFIPPAAADAAIERALNAFPRLGERLYQVAGTLSGGEQQMLALSRAYAQRAPVIMLDEISMGLAPIVVDEIFSFLGRLSAEGHSLLIVEQYVAKALALADFLYVLVRGRLAFAGEAGEATEADITAHYLGIDEQALERR